LFEKKKNSKRIAYARKKNTTNNRKETKKPLDSLK